jgi:hypothetical protein
MHRKTLFIIICSILTAIGITILVLGMINLHYIYLNEFNAQIEKFGFYKEDVQILNQRIERVKTIAALVISSILVSVNSSLIVVRCIDK